MIAVDNDSKVLQIKLSGAVTTNQLDWNVTYYSGGAGANSFDGTTNGATLVTLCPGTTLSVTNPAVISFRLVAMINVYNSDTVPQTVSIIYKNGSSSRTLMKTLLGVGYTLAYEEHEGWYVIDDNGARINIEISLTGIAIGDTVVGSAVGELLYVDAANTLQQVTLTADTIPMASATIGLTDSYLSQRSNFVRIADSKYITSHDEACTIDMGNGLYIQATSNDGSFVHITAGVELSSPLGKEIIIYDGVFGGVPTDPGIWIDNNTFYTIHGSLTASKALVLGANKEFQTSATSATQLGYLSSATGTTGTTSTNLVFSESPTFTGTPVLNTASATSLAITGTAGAGFLELKNQSSTPSTPATALRVYSDNSGRFNLMDTNGYSATFDVTGNSSSRVYTFPNYNGTVATLAGTETFTNKTLTSPVISNSVGSAVGSIEYDGLAFYGTPVSSARGFIPTIMYSIVSSSGFNLSTATGVQSCFETTGDVWTLSASTTYHVRARYHITKSGTTCTIAIAFALGGGASITSIALFVGSGQMGINSVATTTQSRTLVTTVASTVINATASTSQFIEIEGIIRMNAGGTVTPQIDFSASPTSPKMDAGSFIMFAPIGTDSNNTLGNVA